MFKGFCRFPVSGHFPYSRDWKIIIVKGFCHFSCFRHFLDSKGSRNKNDQTPWKNHYFLGFFLFLDNFFTKKMSRNMINNKVAWINDFPKGFCHFFCFWTFYCIQKCLETGQQKHPMTFSISSNSCTIRPSPAPQARGKAWEVYPLWVYPPDTRREKGTR